MNICHLCFSLINVLLQVNWNDQTRIAPTLSNIADLTIQHLCFCIMYSVIAEIDGVLPSQTTNQTQSSKHWNSLSLIYVVHSFTNNYNTAILFPWFPLDSLAVYNDYIHGLFFYISKSHVSSNIASINKTSCSAINTKVEPVKARVRL